MPVAELAAIQTGGFINPWKALAIVIVLLIWARLLTWIDKDAKPSRLPRLLLNSCMLGGLILGYVLFFFLPGFGVAFGVLLLFFFLDVGTYLGLRAAKVGLSDLTDQISGFFTQIFKKGEPKEVVARDGQVLIMTAKGAAQPAPSSDAPDRMGYDAVQQLLTKPLLYNADRLELIAGETSTVNYIVDGVRYEGDPMDRNKSGAAVQYLKRVAGMDMAERRKPQKGIFRTLLDEHRAEIHTTTYGSTAGESLKLVMNPKSRGDFKLDTLGFTDEQLQAVQNITNETGGVVLFGAPAGQGMTAVEYAIIRMHDAFMFHVHTVERAPDLELEGITQNKIPAAAAPPEEVKQVEWVLSQEPDVVLVDRVESPQTAIDLARFANDSRRVYAGLHALNTFDAIKIWRKMIGDDKLAMDQLKMVISSRLVRRLCSACKVGYEPDPNALRKMNMDPATVGKLYQARKDPMRDAKGNVIPCTFCHDLSFHGRFGVYEVFVINDEVKQVILSGGTDAQLRQVFRKYHGKTLQEMSLAHVQVGETSVEEVLRVLRGDAGPEKPPAAARTPAPATPRR
jgi:type II secretory ATPase GspE/PulE/Tfp pilus assembly ATPase PilB-like protein